MSWSVKHKGKVPEVQKSVYDNAQIPQAIHRATGHLLQSYAPNQQVELETYGHMDKDSLKGYATVSVKSVEPDEAVAQEAVEEEIVK